MKRGLVGVLALPALYLGHGNLVASAAFYALLVAAAYVVSLMRHPHRRCRACGGTGRHRGTMFTWGDRPCTTCGGGPRHRRWGVQAYRGDTQTWRSGPRPEPGDGGRAPVRNVSGVTRGG